MVDFLYVSRRNVDFEYNEPLLQNSNCLVLNIGPDEISKDIFTNDIYVLPKSLKFFQSCLRTLKRLSRLRPARRIFFLCEETLSTKVARHILFTAKVNNTERVVFDHNLSRQYQIFFNLLKSNDISVYSIPHAECIFSNTLLDNTNISTIKLGLYKDLAKFIATSKAHQKSVIGETTVLKNIRYSEYWTRKKVSNLPVPKSEAEKTVLVLQSLSSGGVCSLQFQRTLKFLNTLGINVIVRPHPTKGIKEIRNVRALKRVSFSKSSLISDIFNAQIVVHFQSTSFLDAVNLEKPVVFAKFASSNTLHPDYLKGNIVCNNFDEFQEAFRKLLIESKSNSHGKKINQAEIKRDFFKTLKTWHEALDIKC